MPIYPGAPYEYAAAANGLVFTAGACPLDVEGRVVAPGDLEAQAGARYRQPARGARGGGCGAG